MKIYQIHRRGGDYDDQYDDIHKSYLREEDAVKEMTRLIEKSNRCVECKLNKGDGVDYETLNDILKTDMETIRCKDRNLQQEEGYCWCAASEGIDVYDEHEVEDINMTCVEVIE